MRTLITGAGGFLGREVLQAFRGDGEVIPVSRSGREGWSVADVRERDAVRRMVVETHPDVVVHLAAYPDPDFCEDHPDEARRLNVGSVRHLVELLPAGTRLLFVSTDYVFDGTAPPYTETSERHPLSIYGSTKCDAEDLVSERRNSTILRIPLQIGAGPTLDKSGFISIMIKQLRDRDPQLVDDVIARFPTWTRDVAHVMQFLVHGGHDGVFHYSNPVGGTRWHWTQLVAETLGFSSSHLIPSHEVIQRRAQRPVNSQLISSKLPALGYSRCTPVPDVVRDVVRTFGGL